MKTQFPLPDGPSSKLLAYASGFGVSCFGLVGPNTNLFDLLALIYVAILCVLDTGVHSVWSVVFLLLLCLRIMYPLLHLCVHGLTFIYYSRLINEFLSCHV